MRLGIHSALAGQRGAVLFKRALSILRSYGTNAHVFLPGIGQLNGLTAGNYLLADGSTGYTPVDGLVGLTLDGAGSVGAELYSYANVGPFIDQTITPVGNYFQVTGGTTTSRSYVNFTTIVGATYAITVGYSNTTNAVVWYARNGSNGTGVIGATGLSSSSQTLFFTATGTASSLLFDGNTPGGYVLSIVSIRQVTGIHATAAGAARPTLRKDVTTGKYTWQFAGAQSLALGSVPFQIADDWAIVVAATPTSAALFKILFGQATALNATDSLPYLGLTSTNQLIADFNGGGTATSTTSVASYTGTTGIFSCRKIGNSVIIRANGVQVGTTTTVGTYTTATIAKIGTVPRSTDTAFFTGSESAPIIVKGTVTDADLLTLERFVASLTPSAPVF